MAAERVKEVLDCVNRSVVWGWGEDIVTLHIDQIISGFGLFLVMSVTF